MSLRSSCISHRAMVAMSTGELLTSHDIRYARNHYYRPYCVKPGEQSQASSLVLRYSWYYEYRPGVNQLRSHPDNRPSILIGREGAAVVERSAAAMEARHPPSPPTEHLPPGSGQFRPCSRVE